jgi:pimeloyl-ACP methyl ester carboxylesterase
MTAPIRSRMAVVNGVSLDVLEAGPVDGPVVILAHGFPESSWSWRHQLPALADAGWNVIAPDQRGYGRSSRPADVADYGSQHLSADLIGLLDETSQEQAVFVGHDWGALVLWDLVRLHPSRVRAAVGVSVPFVDWPVPPTTLFRQAFGDRFFYILYFQAVGPAEKELEADVRETLRQVLWSGSAIGADQPSVDRPAEGGGFLDGTAEIAWPAELPAWLTEADLDRYTEAFQASGFFGPLSYYRNLDANYERLKDIPASAVSMPVFFITGDRDVVIRLDPGGIDRMTRTLPDFRGAVVLPGIGHWTQQEAPAAFNEALLEALSTL